MMEDRGFAAFDAVAVGITVQDAQGRLVYGNASAAKLIGVGDPEALLRAPPEQLMGAFEVFDEKGQPLPLSELPGRRLMEGKPAVDRLVRFQARDGRGQARWSWVAARLLPGPEPMIVNTFLDASEVVRAQETAERLATTEHRLRLAMDAGNLGTWEWDVPGGVVRWSPELERMHGIGEGTFTGTFDAYSRDIHPEDRERVLATIQNNVEQRTDHALLYRIVRPDGAVRWLEAHGRFEVDVSGAPRRLAGVCMDVTERVQAEEARTNLVAEQAARRAAEEAAVHTREVLAGIADAFMVCSADWVVTFANPESARRLGRPAAEIVGHALWDLLPSTTVVPFEAGLRRAMTERLVTRTEDRVDARDQWLEVIGYPLPDGGLAIYSRDISARRRAEIELDERARELARSNADLEQFAYVASHDLQEPLRIVASYNQLLARRYRGKLDHDADEFIGFSVDGITRMQRLISDLLAYSRVGARGRDVAPVGLDQVFSAALDNLAQAIAESGARITHDPLPAVIGDRGQLVQLLQNLLGNAIKFRGAAPPVIHVGAHRDPQRLEWRFSVSDNGLGIEPQYFDRIFVIFQRLHSRDSYAGTGIGLALCKKIVERHGGRIWVESAAGVGSTFHFTLAADRAG